MKEPLFNPSWYRISGIRPNLRKHAQLHRHLFRGEVWYVLQNHATGQLFRFSSVVYHVIGLMDGKLTIQELWDMAMERFGDDAPTQGDILRMFSQLHSADVLRSDVPPDIEELLFRHGKIIRNKWMMNLFTPLALRFPLLDPEKFLTATIGLVRPFFSLLGGIVWLVTVLSAIVVAFRHWPDLTNNLTDRVLSGQNLLVLGLVYPLVKALHEFGHAFAVKRWGGEVHEMGIMLLVLMPIPYVDASSATAFPEKWRRVMVSAVGMMVELFAASIALFAWVSLGEGIVRAIAFNLILIGSISTVMFNGNPLLRYDGYYIFSDILEIPNLAQRSLNYLGYLFKRYLFGLERTEPPYIARGERFWLTTYSVVSFIYRGFLYASIILFISGKFFIVGMLLGIWAVSSMLIFPVAKRIYFIVASPAVRDKRFRAVASSLIIVAGILAVIFFMPFPQWTRAEGIIWVPEESLVRAGTKGFVERVEAAPNTAVKKGDLLIQCYDPLLAANVRVLEAQLRALSARYDAESYSDRVQARITAEEISSVTAALSRAKERFAELAIRSPGDGFFILPRAEDLKKRYLNQGDLVGYVLNIEKPVVRVVVPQSAVDLIRKFRSGVEVRLAERLDQVRAASIKREVPGALEYLPSPTLANIGGGRIPVDPRDAQGLKTLERMFQFDIELERTVEQIHVGGRVYVRFDHGSEPLAPRWYRGLRRLFLKRFNV